MNNPYSNDIQTQSQELSIRMPLKILIILFWLGQIWTTPYFSKGDFEKYNYNGVITFIDSILQENTLVGGRFSLLEIVLLLLGGYLLFKYRIHGIREKSSKRLFYVSFAVVTISFLNPNNAFDKVKYLITYDPRILLFYLFLLYAFLSVDKKYLWTILYGFIKYGLIVVAAQAVLSLSLFIAGSGIFFISTYTTLPNAEILNAAIILSAIALSAFLKTKKIIFISIVLLIHFLVLFSDRRTPIMALILTDIFIFIYYNKISFSSIAKILLIFILLTVLYYIFISSDKSDFEYHFLRMYSIFGAASYQGEYMNDMGHFQQTIKTFSSIWDNLFRFWGAGMRNDYFYVEGQSGYIHNNFAAVWALYGLHMTLFLFYILFVFAKNTIQMMRKSFKIQAFPIKYAVIVATMFIMAGDAFTGEYFCKHFCYASLFAFTLCFLRLTEEDEEKIMLLFSKI